MAEEAPRALLIKNGIVFDPLNGVNGERMDIAIRDGKIVEDVPEKEAYVIDASGMMVMPGGVDIHAHIAGPEVNAGRLLRPEDHFKDVEPKTDVTRAGVGYSVPSTWTTGYRYARMGWTFVCNPSMPPLEARHTHEELDDTPIIDKATFPLLGDCWFVMEFLAADMVEECAAYVAWMLWATKGYAIKLVNPGGLECWGFGHNVKSIDDVVPYFNITPREIIRGLARVDHLLDLPHTIHVHTNRLGQPGNWEITIRTMDCVRDIPGTSSTGKRSIHVTHVQFSAFGGDDWASMCSMAAPIARYVNMHDHVSIDMGAVVPGDTTTMTADGPFQYGLYELTGNKWINHDVETETSSGIVPYRYRRKSLVNAVQWAIGLELALLVKDPWRGAFITTDHPNGAPFTTYPRVIEWLMSAKAREKTLKRVHRRAIRRMVLPSIDRELTFYEIAILSRAGPARALGLESKGHLGVGADADVAIYAIDPERVDPSRDHRAVRRAFERAAWTIKGGQVVVKDGRVVASPRGRTFWVHVELPEWAREVVRNIGEAWTERYTVSFENYPIPEDYLARPYKVARKARLASA
ncbi:formylmethanofuran dehydrogenase subunit A [Candidatus Bathyarchaeota archaeon]|nr:MAG: formylmethanofuran dehydrogenase subunit A [Candidatus Bathyarchaeota archaeon]